MGGVRSLIDTAAKAVMLKVIDKFKQIDCYGCLSEVSRKVGQANEGKTQKEQRFHRQRTTGVNRASTVRPLDLTRNRLQDMDVNAASPRRRGGVNISGPVSVVRVVVLMTLVVALLSFIRLT